MSRGGLDEHLPLVPRGQKAASSLGDQMEILELKFRKEYTLHSDYYGISDSIKSYTMLL